MKKLTTLKKYTLAAGFGLIGMSNSLWAEEMPSREEMWKMLQLQQKQIEMLTARLNAAEYKVEATEQKMEITDTKMEITGDAIDALQSGGATGSSDGWWTRTQLGGYGELHLNLGRDDEIDFHRWVLFLGHDFTDRIRLFSEVELEHSLAGEGQPGEIELEQAYIEIDFNENHSGQFGVFLLPVGILNEMHEPNTFYGVERNIVEKEIIPTTWWEGGALVHSTFANGFSTDFAVHSGLNVPTTGGSAFRIRSGRQKVAEAEASDAAFTGRVKWTGIPGVELSASAQYQDDIAQSTLNERADALFVTAHADIQRGPWGLRALYARWDIGGDTAALNGANEQYGFYIEPSFRAFIDDTNELGVFARFSMLDRNAGDNVGSEESATSVGVNYWPHPNVVFKFDVKFADKPGDADDEEILNFGVGYQF